VTNGSVNKSSANNNFADKFQSAAKSLQMTMGAVAIAIAALGTPIAAWRALDLKMKPIPVHQTIRNDGPNQIAVGLDNHETHDIPNGHSIVFNGSNLLDAPTYHAFSKGSEVESETFGPLFHSRFLIWNGKTFSLEKSAFW
jgi:hypothetical protein